MLSLVSPTTMRFSRGCALSIRVIRPSTPTAEWGLIYCTTTDLAAIERPRAPLISYRPIHPPSTTNVSPLTYELALEAKNTTAPSKSSGLPHLPAGILSMICLERVGFAMSAEFISVAMYPGAILLTLIPLDAHSLERALVRPTTPCLAAA